MTASQRTRWLGLGGGALSMVLTVSVPLVVESVSAPSRWLHEEARLCSHVRSRAAQNLSIEIGRQAATNGAPDVGSAVAAVADRSGSSMFKCPVSGEPFGILPDAGRWLSARPTTVALVCDCERHPDAAPRATSVFGFDIAVPPDVRMPWEAQSRAITASLRRDRTDAERHPGAIERVGFTGR